MTPKLSSLDIKQLLLQQEGRKRQLNFELGIINQTIKGLKKALPSIEAEEAQQISVMIVEQDLAITAPPPAKKPAQKAKGKKTKQPKPRTAGYRLSEYDHLVFAALSYHNRAILTKDIVSFVRQEKKGAGEPISEEKATNMVARSLQKLANRREEIKKVPYEGRGKAYALPEWLNKAGVIKRTHRLAYADNA